MLLIGLSLLLTIGHSIYSSANLGYVTGGMTFDDVITMTESREIGISSRAGK